VALVALIVSPALTPDPVFFESYQVTMVSELPPEVDEEAQALPQEELVVETPEPEDPEPEPEQEEPEPEPEAEIPPPDPVEEAPPPDSVEEEEPEEARQDSQPVTQPEPAAADPTEEPAEETGADINVRLEGLRRDYPAYYNTIILEINRCFRPPVRDRRAVVHFVIRRDGTVSESDLVERSGHTAFDYAALGAIECAGNGRFGPLPDELPYDRLPIQFTFEPRGRDFGPDAYIFDSPHTPPPRP
jgi:outer membrane biosynthesis protein TonB